MTRELQKARERSFVEEAAKLDKLSHRSSEQFHAYMYLRAFMRWSYKRSYLDVDPMGRMELENPSKSRDRVLSDEELKQVWEAAGDSTFGRIVKLLILTGQRKNEIAKLTDRYKYTVEMQAAVRKWEEHLQTLLGNPSTEHTTEKVMDPAEGGSANANHQQALM